MDQPAISGHFHSHLVDTGGIYGDAALSFATSLVENSNDMIAAVNSDLCFIAINAAFRREFELVFGKPVMLGQRLDDVLVHLTQDRDKAVALCRRALAGESFRVMEDFGDEQFLRKSYELAFSPIFDTHHQPLFAAIVVRDLTTQRLSERRFGALLEAAPDATIIIRGNGSIDLVNTHAERMFGYGRNQMLGMQVEMLLPERFRSRHVADRENFAHHSVARPMGSGRADLLGLRADGSEFPVEISLNPLDVGGEKLVVGAIRDMTVRQRAEDRLRELSADLERRVAERTSELEQAILDFRATFEQAAVGIAHVNTDGRWLRVNQTLCDITGYTRENLLQLSFRDITDPDDLDADRDLIRRLVDGEIPSYSIEKRYRHKDGHLLWINLSASLVRESDGTPKYFILVVKNIDDRKRAEAQLKESKRNLELAIAATGLGMYDYYPQTGEMVWSPETRRHFGMSPDTPVDYGRFLACVHPHDRQRVDSAVQQAMCPATDGNYLAEYRTIGLEDGRERWVEARGKVLFDGDGRAVRFVGATLDITDQKRAEEAVRDSERQLRMIIDANPIGTVRRTMDGYITEANAAYLRIVGRSREELMARRIRWDQMTPPEFAELDRRAMAEAKRNGVSALYEKQYMGPNGERIPVLFACATIGSGHDMVAFILDISERKQAEEHIRLAALHDPLTGLPNRALLFEYARHVFASARRGGHQAAVIFVDLDRFKPINDNHGHETGDEVLKEVARRMRQCTRGEDIVFRLGGDEFLALLPEVDDDAGAGEVARTITERVNRAYRINGLELSLSASIGISIYPRDGEDIDTLMNNADAAMYQAKQGGRDTYQFYSHELAARSHMQSQIEAQIKSALNHDEFRLFYQPVVDMQSGRLTGVEALLRWPHDGIGPDRFVPVAEATGLIGRMGEWVIAEACRQHNAWREHGLPAIPVAVNVSAVQFRQRDFVERFTGTMCECDVPPEALQMELTETALMENLDHAIGVLARLKAAGVKIALDDFGTGYSSLSYLSRLPIDKIKVDKSFVNRIDSDMVSRAITEAIIALGRTLSLEIVAEGIESEHAMHYLRLHGCSQAQGYHVCQPVGADAFESWYRQHYPVQMH